jgi:hypothetical protein
VKRPVSGDKNQRTASEPSPRTSRAANGDFRQRTVERRLRGPGHGTVRLSTYRRLVGWSDGCDGGRNVRCPLLTSTLDSHLKLAPTRKGARASWASCRAEQQYCFATQLAAKPVMVFLLSSSKMYPCANCAALKDLYCGKRQFTNQQKDNFFLVILSLGVALKCRHFRRPDTVIDVSKDVRLKWFANA